MPKEFITIADLTPDERNANRGTLRGSQLLEKSLREYGAGRSALADKNGKIIAGNKTIEGAASIGMEEAIFVHSDGTRPVIVIRDDLDLSDPGGKAQAMAIADNRVGQVSLEWNPDVLAELQTDGVDLEAFWFEDELAELLADVPNAEEWETALDKLPEGDRAPFQQMTFTLADEQAEEIKRAMQIAKGNGPFADYANENSNGNALHRICQEYVTRYGG